MKAILFIFTLTTAFTLQAQDLDPREMNPAPAELFFNYTMLYEHSQTLGATTETREIVIYFNPKSQNIMFASDDPIGFLVVATSQSAIYQMGESLHDGKQAYRTTFETQQDPHHSRAKELVLIKDTATQMNSFDFQLTQYELTYLMTNEITQLTAINNFPIKNAQQLFAFSQIDSDTHLPAGFDLSHVFRAQEWPYFIYTSGSWGEETIQLIDVLPTMYYLDTSNYEFFEKTDQGFEKIDNPFLNQKHPDYFKN